MRSGARFAALWAGMCAVAVSGLVSVAALDRAAASSALTEGLNEALERTVADGFPGAVAYVRDGERVSRAAAGVADIESGERADPDQRFRIASNTKSFVATVLLQLEGEGRLSLDDSVERWLPGVVQGNGNVGEHVRIRQLLNHTSGIYDPTTEPEFFDPYLQDGDRDHVYTPREVVKRAVGHRPEFGPGEDWSYSNTNYLLAGLVIEAVTGNLAPEEIDRRIVTPLKLEDTSFPVKDPTIDGRHLRGYDLERRDMTRFSPSYDWTAGAMISTVDDLARFHRALFAGELLPLAQQRALVDTVNFPGAPDYGLGVQRMEVLCGDKASVRSQESRDGRRSAKGAKSVGVWTTDGGGPGYTSVSLSSVDGERQLVLAANVFDLAAELRGEAPVPRSEGMVMARRTAMCG